MTPKPACHLFSFSLLSPLSVLFLFVLLTACKLIHSLTHSLTHFFHTSPPPSRSHSLTHSLTLSPTHSPIHRLTHLQTHTHTHSLTAQPLRVVTEDTCLFHYLVPAPMSPSNKSVGSDAGSQDSGDGNAGPRSVCVCVRQREREMAIGCFKSF